MSILVIDDEYMIRQTLKELLGELGHEVVLVIPINGQTFIGETQKIIHQNFDLVFLDVELKTGVRTPEIGLHLAPIIKKGNSEIKIILMSGNPDALSGVGDFERQDYSLIDFRLSKPFDLTQVLAAMEKAKES